MCSSTGAVSPPRELGGPPPVMIWGWPINWKEARIWSVTTSNRMGRKLGRVMERNCCQRFAPSTAAASYRSAEMACIPARKMIVLNPIVHHSVAMLTVIQAHGFDARKFGLDPKIDSSVVGMNPALLLNIHHQVSPTTATERVQGTK